MASALEALLARRQQQLAQIRNLGSAPSAAQTPLSPMGPPGSKSHAGLTGLLSAYTGGVIGSHVGNALAPLAVPAAPQAQSFSPLPTDTPISAGSPGGKALSPPPKQPQQNLLQKALSMILGR